MYLARIKLTNWRSYDQAVFDFRPPSRKERKPIILIGAMNGHGKTSFLLSLYLGMFGRFGLRYCEGFRSSGDGDSAGYRRAIENYRRNTADPGEPTEVDLTFSPTSKELDKQKEVRIVRRWYFTSSNKLKQGDGFEDVQLFIDGKPVKSQDIEALHSHIEMALFPAHVTPAFFFDGEQAQALIEKMGEEGLRKAVEVMFGMRVITELRETLKTYLTNAHNKAGGKGRSSAMQDKLDELKKDRDAIDSMISKRQKELQTLRSEHESMARDRSQKMEQLTRYGGAATRDVGELNRQLATAQKTKTDAERALTAAMSQIGINLALYRLGPAVRNRLRSEAERESWENLRAGTLAKKEEVLSVALPEPASDDPILGSLPIAVRNCFRDRLLSALDRIYNPPPSNCAEEYLFGHIRGDHRNRVVHQLDQIEHTGGNAIQQVAGQVKSAREQMEDAQRKLDRITNLPEEVKLLKTQIDELNDDIGTAGNRIGQLENEITGQKGQLHDLNATIQRLQEELAKLEPEQKRLAVAERVNRVIEALTEQLAPTTASRLEALVTKHFLALADERFQGGKIQLRPNHPPQLIYPGDRPASLLEVMSGFESRSFGIAFSLALAEITRRRIPLVIDTPLGNADSEYRPRTLSALRQFDLDQIIILTHDEEVTSKLYEEIKPFVNQTFLVRFDQKEKKSNVMSDQFFGAGQ